MLNKNVDLKDSAAMPDAKRSVGVAPVVDRAGHKVCKKETSLDLNLVLCPKILKNVSQTVQNQFVRVKSNSKTDEVSLK